ncbi:MULTISPECIES: hypothetical protein [Lactiplantibacillus]|uniref:Uncharacterized protein n=1 Tax=Lactiplantibacillus pentosus TaxID=1589 RepID=A0AAW8WID7_LACPE|nr:MULTISPECIES: hypothetical protein [Lactiplantibacillus]MBU7460725.1 hypothetical protein [Lactiplantibacillus pentosus]MBU7478949.1 hypothetical protein [Lactiplantibacillus pentosus]MBU7483401.1 hypothetical protein [Lactiplantibacillus sp. 30.2.29]MBU7486726.1 hypothetical protein [Lactiplantibacillus pentosus]MBU7499752.1 hypothetical protein [Lactiplantibacillus pentosus]
MDESSHKFGTFLNLIYPLLFSALFISAKFFWKLDYTVLGFDKILDSTITFSSIIIGFYTAMYGVLITLKDSDIMRAFRRNKLTGILKFQLYDSLTISFGVLLTSVLMQSLINYPGVFTGCVTNIWTLFIGYFIATSFRAITLLLNIMFHSDDESQDENTRCESVKSANERYKRLDDEKDKN